MEINTDHSFTPPHISFLSPLVKSAWWAPQGMTTQKMDFREPKLTTKIRQRHEQISMCVYICTCWYGMLLSISCFIFLFTNEYTTNMHTLKAVSVMSLLLTFETFLKQNRANMPHPFKHWKHAHRSLFECSGVFSDAILNTPPNSTTINMIPQPDVPYKIILHHLNMG